MSQTIAMWGLLGSVIPWQIGTERWIYEAIPKLPNQTQQGVTMKPLQNVGCFFSFAVTLADASRTGGAHKVLNGSPVVHHRWQSKRISDMLQISIVDQNQVAVSEGD